MYCNGINKDGDNIYIAGWTEVQMLTFWTVDKLSVVQSILKT
jgi:hypothetical protein